MAWLSGWNYRKSITLSRASGVVTNYQMKLLLGESAGATGEDVDCNGHVLSNFNDVRFTTSDGTTLLDYWIEQIAGVTPNRLATVWIEFDSIGTGDTTFYMYYGNSGAAAYSDGSNTFIGFDDFERGVDGDPVGGIWSTVFGTVQISIDQAYGGTRSCKLVGDATIPQMLTTMAASANLSALYRIYKADAAQFDMSHGDGTTRAILRAETDEDISVFNGSIYVDTGSNISPDTWQLIEFNDWNWTAKTVDVWLNGVKIKDDADISYTNNLIANAIILLQSIGIAGTNSYIDNFIVRNWRATEPTWGSWGNEESIHIPRHGFVNFQNPGIA